MTTRRFSVANSGMSEPSGPGRACALLPQLACVWLLVLALLAGLPLAAWGQADEPAPGAGVLDELFADEELDDEDLFGEEGGDGPPLDASDEALASDDQQPAEDTTLPLEPEPGALAPPPSAIAPSEGVEEILVQGQAATGLEADATVSVTQFDSADLEALGVEDVSDVAQFTPNLEIRTGSATAPTFFIRGIGLNDFTANASGAIAIYQDDVSLSLPAIQLGQLFDVEQLEILRGPQGSGAARNASGGAIKVYARKPEGDLNGSLKLSYGRFNEHVVEGSLGLPLISDVLAARGAFIISRRDPLVRNRCAGAPVDDLDRITSFRADGVTPNRVQPAICDSPVTRAIENPFPDGPNQLRISAVRPGLEDGLNDTDRWAARLQLRLTPPDSDMDWLLNVHAGKIDQLAATGQGIGTVATGGKVFGGTTASGYRAREIAEEEDAIFARLGGTGNAADDPLRDQARRILARRLARRLDKKPFTGDFNRTGKERMQTIGGFLRGELEFDWAHLTSITAIERYDRFRNLDADYTSDVVFEFLITDRAWQVSQELQLAGELEQEPLRWHAGVYYLMDQLDFDNETVVAPPRQRLVQVYDQETFSLGIFGGFEWDFHDDLTLEGGIRHNWERKTFDIDLERGLVPICGTVVCQDQQTWQDPSGTIKLSYHFTDETVAYASYSRGFKSGQFSVGGASGDSFTVAEPETVDSFEVGLKGDFFDGALQLQAALFHYTYEDYQVFLAANDAFTPPQRVVVNSDDAVLYGGELETKLVPFLGYDFLEGLELTSRFGWIESEFLEFTQRIFRTAGLSPADPILPVDVEWTGNRLPNTPRFKWSATLEYTLDLGRYGALVPRFDTSWTDDAFFDASDGTGIPDISGRPVLPDFAIGQPAYWLHNFRLAWRNPENTVEVAAWVRNLADDVYKTLAFDASEGANLVGNLVGDPRTYGVTLSLNW